MNVAQAHLDPPVLGSRGRDLARAVGLLATTLAVLLVAVVPPAEQDSDDLYTSGWHYLRDIGLLAYLVATVVLVEIVRRRGLAGTAPARLVQVGYSLVALGVVAGLALGEDPGWFFVLAGPGILASVVGFVWWAVSAGRSGAVPVWLAVLLGVGGVTAIVGAEFGTPVLIGSFWLFLAARRRGHTPLATAPAGAR